MSNSLRPHESQHAKPPCPAPTPGVHSDSRPSSSDAIQPAHLLSSPSPPAPNPSQHQSLIPMSQLFAWGGQSTGVSALASFLPKKSQGWSPSEWTGLNQGKLEVVKQEIARVNIDILGISKLKWTGKCEFNSDDYYIYYCGQESLREME